LAIRKLKQITIEESLGQEKTRSLHRAVSLRKHGYCSLSHQIWYSSASHIQIQTHKQAKYYKIW